MVILPAVIIVIAAFPLWLMFRASRARVWNWGVDVLRDERPIGSWFGITIDAITAALIVAFAIYVAWDQLH